MDEAFWANVVKRWSDASDTVLKLRKELAKVQEERELYRDVVQSLRNSGAVRDASRTRASGHAREESINTIVVDDEHAGSVLQDELKDAEIGLGRAKEEYRRLQKELAESLERVRVLTLENERLASNQRTDTGSLHEERRKTRITEKELEDVRSKNQLLTDKVQQLEEELKFLRNAHGGDSAQLTPRPGFLSPPSFLSFQHQKQLDDLKQELELKDDDNANLRQELEEVHSRLRKTEESNQSLMNSIKKLQNITRQSTGALQAISANFLASSPRPRRLSLASSSRSRGVESGTHTRNVSASSALEIPGEDDTVIGKLAASSDSPYFSLPSERENALVKLPAVPAREVDPNNLFERDFLKDVLGSLTQRPVENVVSKADGRAASSYLCPTLNHHPWCPSTPGQHGYIFVGLGKEKDTYRSPVIRHLFVGLPKAEARSRRFRYLGQYRVMRVRSLALEEWNLLPEEVKLMYVKLTKEKTKDSRTPDELLGAYNNGDLLVPCVLLQCISFDDQLYETLISRRDAAQLP